MDTNPVLIWKIFSNLEIVLSLDVDVSTAELARIFDMHMVLLERITTRNDYADGSLSCMLVNRPKLHFVSIYHR